MVSLGRWRCAFLLWVGMTSAAAAEEAVWQLVWEDRFDREVVGDQWEISGEASLMDGRLVLEGENWAYITRPFAADVRLEYIGEALPGIPPCDLSAMLATSGSGYGGGYRMQFGRQGNRENSLGGPGVSIIDKNPPFLIEHGRQYRLVAEKDGPRISYAVDGQVILEATTEDPLVGEGHDRVGILSWAGTIVHSVKVYERVPPNPHTPRAIAVLPEGPLAREGRRLTIRPGHESDGLSAGVTAFNSGDLEGALAAFRALGDTEAGLLGEAYVLGDLDYRERYFHTAFEDFAARFQRLAAAHPGDSALADHAAAARWFANLRLQRSASSALSALRLINLGPDHNPYYHKAIFYRARLEYWGATEGSDQAMMREALGWMDPLRELWPEHPLLRQYAGEQIPWREEINAATDVHPAWAAYLREAYTRNVLIMEHFIRERQAPDGQFGGGWNDDVEMMRSWQQIAAISTAATMALDGIERLAEGVWTHRLNLGFANHVNDVQHSAEESADTLPGMLMVRYGDPLWVERNLRSCKTIRDYYMGIDPKGHPRFRSSIYGDLDVEEQLLAGGGSDTGYNARTMKHFQWAAWQGNPEAKDWYIRWAEGWREATMAANGTKLPGVTPPSLWFLTGDIVPPFENRSWHDEKANWLARPDLLPDVFLAAYDLSGDRRFLEPVQVALEMASRGPIPRGPLERGSAEWQYAEMAHLPNRIWGHQNLTAVYRWLTGESVFDEYTRNSGNALYLYQIDGDSDQYLKSFEGVARSMRHNLDLMTSEALQTDRINLPMALEIFGAYTGAVSSFRDAELHTFAVTYDTPSIHFAGLVKTATPRRLRVWLYHFEDEPMTLRLRTWRLVPGVYTLNQGAHLPGERAHFRRYAWAEPQSLEILRPVDGPTVTIPPRTPWVVDLRLNEARDVPERAPDLALAPRDLERAGDELRVTVHNIGNGPSEPVDAVLQAWRDGAWQTLQLQSLPGLPAPADLSPSTANLTFIAPPDERLRVVLDPEGRQFDRNPDNHTAASH